MARFKLGRVYLAPGADNLLKQVGPAGALAQKVPVLLRALFYQVCVAFVVTLVSVSPASPTSEQKSEKEECTSKYQGSKPTPEVISAILADHQAWLYDIDAGKVKENAPDERRANLCKADLSGANLQKANLDSANLQNADLGSANLQWARLGVANLQNAFLSSAKLQNADLFMANLQNALLDSANLQDARLRLANLQNAFLSLANLQNADLFMANLQNADLDSANLQKANLDSANLQNADLSLANLTSARLVDVDVTDATLAGVNLTNATYETYSIPVKGRLGGITGLKTVKFDHAKGKYTGLVLLRAALKDVGLRDQEREVTYVLEREKTQHAGWIESRFRLLFFEWPCVYGFDPGRPLGILVGLIGVFTFVYVIPIRRSGESGIYQVWSEDRIRQDQGASTPQQLHRELVKAFGYAWYFSLLSAFHFGWRELNVGNWLVRMQAQDYTLRATGWVRVVAGIQSLISVYLVALWALTYFGRPFE